MHEENNHSIPEESKSKESMPQESKKSEGDGVFKAGLILLIILVAAFLFGKPMNESEKKDHFQSDGFPNSPSSLFTPGGNSD